MTDPTQAPLVDPADTQRGALLGVLRQVLVLVGGLLAAHGIVGPDNTITPDRWEFIVGAIVTLAPMAWSWYEKFRVAKTAQARETIAVQAGINLVTSGAALVLDRSTVLPPSTAKALPVTPESAQEIIKNFGPTLGIPSPAGTITDDLNAASLARATAGSKP